MDKDELIKALLSALVKSHDDAVYWLYEASGKKPERLESNKQVHAAIQKAKDMGY
jgi:hypothetical protein